MLKNADRLAHAVKLLIGVAACAVDPTGVKVIGVAASGYLSLRGVSKSLSPEAKVLATELTEGLKASLAEPGLPAEANVLMPQMIEAGLPKPDDIVTAGLQPEALVDLMVVRLTDPEHIKVEMVAAFKSAVTPILGRLLNDRTFVEALGPQITREMLRHSKETADALDDVRAKYGSLARSLDELRTLHRSQLEALARRFGFDEPDTLGDEELRDLLEAKAGEYRVYKTNIDAIDEHAKGLGNLKGAAKEATERLDFAEVENLLSRVDQVETEIAAKTKELRAENALLRGRVDEAFDHFSAAADGFVGIDKLEPARRRLRHGDRLFRHGLRYGGSGLALSERMIRAALDQIPADQTLLWAPAQNALADTLEEQGGRVGGEPGAKLQGQAVTGYRAALGVYTEDTHPVAWATTQNNLGNALARQGTRIGGEPGAELLSQAVAAHRAALRVTTEDAHPVAWARTQNNLGNALQEQSARVGGEQDTELLDQAVAAYRVGLRIRTEDAYPEQWARTQNNLGAALQEQGNRIGGEPGVELLGQAVAAYRAALRVGTEDAHPVDWARTQNNLGAALHNQGTRVGGEQGAVLLGQAVTAYRAALRVSTEDAHPVDWARTQNNLGNALHEQGTRIGGERGEELLGDAVAAYRAALRVRTVDAQPVDWAMTQNNLGNALLEQGGRAGGEPGAELLRQAVAALHAALRVRTEDAHPADWAATQNNLAIVEVARATHETCTEPRAHLEAALAHVEAALTVFDPDHTPRYHQTATALRDDIAERLAAL